MKTLIRSSGFRRWIENSLTADKNVLATSNQGIILRYQEDGLDLVVKSAMGPRVLHRARLATLRREYAAYRRMDGVEGVPRCHAMLDNRYLVLDYIDGKPYRQAHWEDRAGWFAALLRLINEFHARGVSHGDLKSKSNIIVTSDQKPCVIDFGTAILQKPGFHPLNQRLFEYGRRLDLNAWVKHKYFGSYQNVSEQDRQYLNYSRLERLLRRFRF